MCNAKLKRNRIFPTTSARSGHYHRKVTVSPVKKSSSPGSLIYATVGFSHKMGVALIWAVLVMLPDRSEGMSNPRLLGGPMVSSFGRTVQ